MFSKIIKNSQGYTLFLTVVIIVLFSVVGLSLITITVNGTAKNNIREDSVQSLNLAEKGQDFIINEINTALSKFTEGGKSRDDFIDELERYNHTHSRYKCNFDGNGNLISGLTISTKNSSDDSIACIKNVYPVYEEDGTLNDLKRKLEIVSVGDVNGNRKQLTTFVEIGADRIPEQLKYALTSKSNIHLNGAVQITGDLRFNGSLTTFNHSHIVKGQHHWVPSIKPSIKSTSRRSNPRIVVSENSHFYHVTGSTYYAQTLYNNIHNLNNSSLTEVERKDINQLFDTSVFDRIPTVVISDAEIKEVNITDVKAAYEYKRSSASDLNADNNLYVPSGNYNNRRYLVRCDGYCTKKDNELKKGSTFKLRGNYVFDQLATSANLKIEGGTSNNPTKVTIKDTLYVEGDLIIEGHVELNGSIFVNGRLKIGNTSGNHLQTNTFVKVNSLIYVNSSSINSEAVDIQYSTINSLPYVNAQGEKANGTLIIFSKGKVKLSNNSSFEDTPSKIYGYFYSDEAIEIYGSGSNMEIHGGISGNRITLHAIRGKAKDNSFNDSYEYNSWYFLKASLQKSVANNSNELSCNYPDKNGNKKCYKYDSRLQVHYNEDVIATYIELNRIEQLVYTLNPPKIVDKKL